MPPLSSVKEVSYEVQVQSELYSLSVVVPFVAILILFIAAAVLAQTSGAGQPNEKANAVLAATGSSVSAHAEDRLSPWAGAGSSPVSGLRTKRYSARPMETIPPSFVPVVNYSTGGFGYGGNTVAVVDVNGDGKLDIVVANMCNDSPCTYGSVGALLGNGDGTFQPVVVHALAGLLPVGIAVADLNGDGKPDLAVALWSGEVAVMLGNGDGTFQPPVTYGSGCGESTNVAIADVNRDGKPDLVVANSCSTVGVLLGNGDGTFQPAVTYDTGSWPNGVAVADVNGDGNPDVLTADLYGNTVAVLLGNYTGTFQVPVTYGSGGVEPASIAVADVKRGRQARSGGGELRSQRL